jgi:hypothetical protein
VKRQEVKNHVFDGMQENMAFVLVLDFCGGSFGGLSDTVCAGAYGKDGETR